MTTPSSLALQGREGVIDIFHQCRGLYGWHFLDFLFRVRPRSVAFILSLAVLLSILAAIYILATLLKEVEGGSVSAIYVALLIVAVALSSIASMYMTSIRVSPGRVYVVALPIVRYSIERRLVEDIRVADLSAEGGLRPLLRLFGVRIPGYSIGWFMLRNRSRAFVIVTRTSGKAVIFRLRDGKLIILQPEDLEGFVQILRSLGWSVSGG